jgi:uncharacterized protein
MEFEWDDEKRRDGIAKHGVDLLYAATIFAGVTVTAVDGRTDYGEQRQVSIGMVGDECFVVVFTERTGRIRLISARKGGRRDRRKFETGFAGRNPSDESGGGAVS